MTGGHYIMQLEVSGRLKFPLGPGQRFGGGSGGEAPENS